MPLFSENAPDPPKGLRALTVSSRAIELTWESSPPKNGRTTMAYSVHYLLTNGKSFVDTCNYISTIVFRMVLILDIELFQE